ncbi:hypothetical protein HMN09_01378200 [Mycena chlorophos]|uniref:F-box domain-containing protein n=1 Tax=Mycena chlorophos TaxID=658473 RepID=A0A8H6VNX5_MYCCL|nr:hypothetical protein HMN09_01378200 [Mycena chlorophos]
MLPVELYAEIAGWLPSKDRHVMLGVSRQLHDVALRLIFQTIRIYFMYGVHGSDMLHTESNRYVQETSDFCSNRSWEVLQHIIATPSFARVVRTLSVHAFTDGPQIYEHRTLSLALKSMHNLHSLYYHGQNPSFEKVAASVPPSLRFLCLQSMPDPQLLSHLHQLQWLQATTPFLYVRDQKLDRIFAECTYDLGDPHDIVVVLNSNLIRQLSVLATHLPLLPIWLYNNLTVLDICVTDWEIVGMELLFRHAVQLRELSLVGYIEPSFFPHLPADPETLPNLTSFRLSCELWDEEAVAVSIAPYLVAFLERRVDLERLYIRLPGISLPFALILATAIAKLQRLRVLGFHIGYEPLHEAAAHQLAGHFSTHLQALHLVLPWMSELHVRTWYPLLAKLQRLEDLSFLSLFSSGEDPVPIHPMELATDLPRLRLVGLQRSLFTIDRDAEDWEPKLWTPWKVKYCIREDFESEDHWWLFRYH